MPDNWAYITIISIYDMAPALNYIYTLLVLLRGTKDSCKYGHMWGADSATIWNLVGL